MNSDKDQGNVPAAPRGTSIRKGTDTPNNTVKLSRHPLQTQLEYLEAQKKLLDVSTFWPRIAPLGSEEPSLSSQVLAGRVAPMVGAIEQLQRYANLGRNPPYVEPRVILIQQNSPIEFSMVGVSEAYKTLRDDIIPWRARHQRELAALEQQERLLRVEKLRDEIEQAHGTRLPALEVEGRRLELESRRLEIEKCRAELRASQVRLAIEVMDKLFPSATEAQRLEYFANVFSSISNLEGLHLAVRASSNEEAKPS